MKFASGIEKASFVTSSRLLCRSWSAISSSSASSSDNDDEAIVSHVGVGLSWKVNTEQDSDLTIIAFKATLDALDLSGDLISSSELREANFLDFEFLCSRRYPHFSLNRTAVSLFRDNHQQLDSLRSQISSSNQVTRLIVTGHGIGGAIASLFTISLLHNIGSRKKRPLCITFGSPLVGDKKLQQAIACSSTWSSCFLHVVSHMDPVPRLYITNPTSAYMPFGTFLVCSHATSFENPDSVLEILVALGSIHDQNQGFKYVEYGNIVENLYQQAICKDFSADAEKMSYPDSLSAGISLQLRALGLTSHMQKQQKNIDVNILERKLKELEEKFIFQKRTSFDPSKKLNHEKRCMTQLEWGQEQWVQCDDCSKWRKLPVDVLLPPKWTCSENVWDTSRSTCSAPEEPNSRELENVLKTSKDFKKRRVVENSKLNQEHEPSGLDALASAAVLGENLIDHAESSSGATTKHPRHRPGCSCIVCIQPPSGKGRHKPTCTCNVCSTVKRRFKTLMLQKRKRQSEVEADATSQKDS